MFRTNGYEILTTLEEKVRPSHTAVLVIDMQKDFTTPGCFWDELDQVDTAAMTVLVSRLKTFLDEARAAGVLVVNIRSNYHASFMNAPMHERLYRHGVGRYCQPDTVGYEFHDGLEPGPGEPVVTKHRFDAFYDTNLDILLRSHHIQTVIATGVVAHGCVDSTCRHAYFAGYYVVYSSDLTGGASPAVHEMTLDSMKLMFGVCASSEEIIKAWHSSVAIPTTGAISEDAVDQVSSE